MGVTDFSKPEVLAELGAVLNLNPQLEAIIQDELIDWVYYISEQKFFYLMLETSLENQHINQAMYNSAFWQTSQPNNNPSRDSYISNVYDDSAGTGIVATYINPLYDGDEFKGVMAFDIDTQNLLHLVTSTLSLGESFLIDTDGNTVNGHSQMGHLSELTSLVLSDTEKKFQVNTEAFFYASPLVEDFVGHERIVFAHKISHQQLNSIAINNSATFWLILVAAYLLIVVVLKKHATAQVSQRLMMIDPLTNILNRRGLEHQLRAPLDSLEQNKGEYAILLADIDHFKSNNDQYGHDVGDKAL